MELKIWNQEKSCCLLFLLYLFKSVINFIRKCPKFFTSFSKCRIINLYWREKSLSRSTSLNSYNCCINTHWKLAKSSVYIDAEQIGLVWAVKVLTILGRQTLLKIIWNITPTPQKSGKSNVVFGSSRPNWLSPILNEKEERIPLFCFCMQDV